MKSFDNQQYLELARVLKPQGIKGEVKLRPFTDDLKRFSSLPHVFIERDGQFVKHMIDRAWVYKGFAFLKLRGFDTRNAAELLRNNTLYIDRAAMEEDEGFFIADLIGLSVVDGTGAVLGKLHDVIKTGGVDVYHVVGDEREFLFPLAPGVVADTDLDAGTIAVNEDKLREVMIDA